jgi:uncharacterized membrane protein
MDKKTLSVISYVTIIGWIIAYFSSKEKRERLVSYHLKQGLGIFIVAVIFNIAFTVIASIVPSLYFLGYVGYAFLIFMILGIINAMNEKEIPIPLIGKMFEDKFAFIDQHPAI